jgi:multidrug transporter EmrE-like cation transporter
VTDSTKSSDKLDCEPGFSAPPANNFAYTLLIIGGILDCGGELLLKKGTSIMPALPHAFAFLAKYPGASAMFTIWTWLGIISYISGLLCWLNVLKSIPLSVAFPVINGLHMGVPVGAYFILHEPFPLKRWLGIALVLCGALLILKPVAKAEEKL